MPIADVLLAEFESQVPITRRFLERIPADKLTWKPHDRSMTAGQLAYHLAMVPGGVVRGAQQNQIAPPDFQHRQPETRQEILDTFDQSVATVREVLPTFDDAAMHATWRIVAGEKEIAAMPRVGFLRHIMLNHWYQHRGQFSVYLRMLGEPVPASWGPSADESPLFPSRDGAVPGLKIETWGTPNYWTAETGAVAPDVAAGGDTGASSGASGSWSLGFVAGCVADDAPGGVLTGTSSCFSGCPPAGNCSSGLPAMATRMKSIHMGRAALAPVSLSPRDWRSS